MGNLVVTSSPHIRSKKTTQKIMLDVIIALLPAVAASTVLFGVRALLLIVISALTCVALELGWFLIMKKRDTTSDLSAVVTGILLALNVPASLPVWQLMVGCLVAIIVVKQLFGGLGFNFVNPALAGRVVMGLSFTSTMTNYDYARWTPDGMAGATPLGQIDALSTATPGAWQHIDKYAEWGPILFGTYGGVMGETCAIALIIGGIYLVARGIIKPIIPLCYIGTVFVLQWAFGSIAPLRAVLTGGLLLGSIYMATDYTTSPYTNWGKVVFGVGCGLITAVIRTFSSTTEGVSYAILIMNLLVPYINGLTRKEPYGGKAA